MTPNDDVAPTHHDSQPRNAEVADVRQDDLGALYLSRLFDPEPIKFEVNPLFDPSGFGAPVRAFASRSVIQAIVAHPSVRTLAVGYAYGPVFVEGIAYYSHDFMDDDHVVLVDAHNRIRVVPVKAGKPDQEEKPDDK